KLDDLLFRDGALARTLAGAGIGARPLTAHRQRAAMTGAAVAADFHQPLDVHRHVLAEGALDAALLLDDAADLPHAVLGEGLHAPLRPPAGFLEDDVRARPSDPEDVREADLHPLGDRQIHACNSRHNS